MIELSEHGGRAILEGSLLFIFENLESSELLLDVGSPETFETLLARFQQELLRHGSKTLTERFWELKLEAILVTSEILDFPTRKYITEELLAMKPVSDLLEIVLQIALRILKIH